MENKVTFDMMEKAADSLQNSPDYDGDFYCTVDDEQLRDLAFNNNLWARIRRKFFGLSEIEVTTLIKIHNNHIGVE